MMGKYQDRNEENKEESKMETDDAFNQTLYGSLTIGGVMVFGIIALLLLYDLFFR